MSWITGKIKHLVMDGMYSAIPVFARSGVIILMYHSVGNNSEFFTVGPEDFERQMRYLKEQKFNIISLRKLIASLKNKNTLLPKTVILTFDDGYQDNYENAFPILKKYNFPATIFLTTGRIGDKNYVNKRGVKLPMLDWNQIKEMHDAGFIDFEPHSVEHPHLTKIDIRDAEREILNSKRALEEALRKTCPFFAYPYGDYSEEVKKIAAKHFEAAVTVRKGVVKVKRNTDFWEIPRNSVDSEVCFTQFTGIVRFGGI